MHDLKTIVRLNEAAANAAVKKAAAQDAAKESITLIDPDTGEEMAVPPGNVHHAQPAGAPRPARINMIQITLIHNVDTQDIMGTATAPYITDPSDQVIVRLRNLLIQRFEELTRPLSPENPTSPVWGEYTHEDDARRQEAQAIRVPKPKAILTPDEAA